MARLSVSQTIDQNQSRCFRIVSGLFRYVFFSSNVIFSSLRQRKRRETETKERDRLRAEVQYQATREHYWRSRQYKLQHIRTIELLPACESFSSHISPVWANRFFSSRSGEVSWSPTSWKVLRRFRHSFVGIFSDVEWLRATETDWLLNNQLVRFNEPSVGIDNASKRHSIDVNSSWNTSNRVFSPRRNERKLSNRSIIGAVNER